MLAESDEDLHGGGVVELLYIGIEKSESLLLYSPCSKPRTRKNKARKYWKNQFDYPIIKDKRHCGQL